eukprot:11624221-Karenia_brevis.AAC.1
MQDLTLTNMGTYIILKYIHIFHMHTPLSERGRGSFKASAWALGGPAEVRVVRGSFVGRQGGF